MKNNKGYSIYFVDIDETLFRTFAKIRVVKNGELIKELTNKEYNIYELKEGESFDYEEFFDGKLFKETSIPINNTINRVKEIIDKLKETKSKSRIIILTARQDFHDKENFLEAFTQQGIDVSNKDLVYIHRAGNIREGTIAQKKQKVIINYLKEGIYRRCVLIDDDIENLNMFVELGKKLPKEVEKKVIETYNIESGEEPILFFAMHVDEKGEIKLVSK